MDKDIRIKLFNSYNSFMAKAYEDTLAELAGKRGDGINSEVIKKLGSQIDNMSGTWCDMPSDDLDGMSPLEVIKGIESPQKALEIFKIGAVISDFGFPLKFLERLTEFGGEVYNGLIELALFPTWAAGDDYKEVIEEDLIVAAEAMKILGAAKPDGLFELATAKLIESEDPEEYIADAYIELSKAYGASAYDHITGQLNLICDSGDGITVAYEYLMSALCQAEEETIRINSFDCIRKCFRKMDNKMLGAMYIGDLGNPRGIRVLKSFLDSGAADDDRELFYQVVSAVRKLGGDITDIHDPFRDFA